MEKKNAGSGTIGEVFECGYYTIWNIAGGGISNYNFMTCPSVSEQYRCIQSRKFHINRYVSTGHAGNSRMAYLLEKVFLEAVLLINRNIGTCTINAGIPCRNLWDTKRHG